MKTALAKHQGKKKEEIMDIVRPNLNIIIQYKSAIKQKNTLIANLKIQEAKIAEATSKLPTAASKLPTATSKLPTAAPKLPTAAPKTTQGSVIQGNLINTNSTMCYLDAAMQMLLAIPEIPQFFANTTYEQISELEQITNHDDLILNACASSDKSKEKQNIIYWKMIFDKIRTESRVSIKDIGIPQKKGSSYAKLVLGCQTNAFLTPDKKKYKEADPSELMTLLFFPNFSCLIIPSINETVGIIKEEGTHTRNKTHVLTMMFSPQEYNFDTSVARLLETHAFGILFPLEHGGNYLIMGIGRAYIGDDGNFKKNQTRVEITREIDIVGVKFIIKGCIFHSGDGQNGHYVYGVYDDAGNPDHVIDDLKTVQNARDVFNQNGGWMSTMFLYRRMQ